MGIGQVVAEQSLQHPAAKSQGGADGEGEQHPRRAETPHHRFGLGRRFGEHVESELVGEHTEYLIGR